MSLEQSKKIVEAAGGCWHEHTRGGSAGLCKFGDHYFNSNENPDLFLPENRHLLVGYVEKICNAFETSDGWKTYLYALCSILGVSVPPQYFDWDDLLQFHEASNEAIMDAISAVIEGGRG